MKTISPNPNDRPVAITGITGFIGQRLCQRLLKEQVPIRALVRSEAQAHALESRGIRAIVGDLSQRKALQALLHDSYALLHCAASVRGLSADDFHRVNHRPVRLLMQLAHQADVDRFFFMSSLAARQPELSYYAHSKYQAEQYLLQSRQNMPCFILRPPAVYGPGDREMRPLFDVMRYGFAPMAAPKQARLSLIYVDDLVDAIAQWLLKPQAASGLYELHDGHVNGYSWHEIIEQAADFYQRPVLPLPIPKLLLRTIGWTNQQAARLLGYSPMLTLGKSREITHADWVCDNTQVQQVLPSWQPKTQLAEGLAKTLTTVHETQ